MGFYNDNFTSEPLPKNISKAELAAKLGELLGGMTPDELEMFETEKLPEGAVKITHPENLKRFIEVCKLAEAVAKRTDGAFRVVGTEISIHGTVCIDYPRVASIADANAMNAFASLISLCDRLTFAAAEEKGVNSIRFTFAVENVWYIKTADNMF